MWKALQSGLSAIAGTAEPEYGSGAIHPVANTYRATTDEDMCFQAPPHTNVETMTFYFSTDTHSGFFQILHSNMMSIQVTAQMNFKIFNIDAETRKAGDQMVWKSIRLDNFEIVNGHDFKADNVEVTMVDSATYHIKSTVGGDTDIDLTFTRVGDGVIFGENGTTLYGDDINEPWGSMRHSFWPRCEVKGDVEILNAVESADGEETKFESERKVEIDGLGMYVLALQGMKPHHAAATWDFLIYQSDNYTAVLMEFTTPPSYATTTISAGIVVDGKGSVVVASTDIKTEHLNNKHDETSGWEVPQSITYNFADKVIIKGDLNNLIERVDVMAAIPQFVKNIASAASGTKPYIYQFGNWFDLEEGSTKETSWAYSETTFISAI